MSFIARMCSMRITSLLPVVVMKMSALPATSSSVTTSNPSMAACRAQIGSTSVTFTRAPAPRSFAAEPCPRRHSRRPATLPAIITSVARRMPSTSDPLQPYLLSNFDLVTLSLTLIAGKAAGPLLQVVKAVNAGGGFSETPWIASRCWVNQPGLRPDVFLIWAKGWPLPLRWSGFRSARSRRLRPGRPAGCTWWRRRHRPGSCSPGLRRTGRSGRYRSSIRAASRPDGEDRDAGRRDRRRRVILGREDVARGPADLGPSAVSVSISTAVCTVMCRLPAMRAPFSGWARHIRRAAPSGPASRFRRYPVPCGQRRPA